MPHRIPPNKAPHFACGLLVLALSAPAWAQNKALELSRDKTVDLQPSMRENLVTIGRYAESVNRQIGKLSGESAAPETQPLAESPARREIPPGRRMETMIDPFEVSPQLRDGRRSPGNFSGLPVASKLDIQRQVQVKALLVTARGRGAQLLVRGQQAILVKDGDLVDFGDLGTFTIHVGAVDGVTLTHPGLPQGNKITLR
ncbi:hypothetical protein KI614_05955 [Dechloromonas denitrificans]|uniref:hypothetical protein n=1 Tax=Dechloromonas denitrificans TaxID=281362 RepID=UPI001CF89A70|nr:hypothetical protein [Dechloromonas denitrificans]UCV12755.1 hypothetical protein KI614_05955 [Dechloromonas denitrificans]